MSSGQTTSQIVEQPKLKLTKIIYYKTQYYKEKKNNEDLKKKIEYLQTKINKCTNCNNKGEKDEISLLLDLYHFNDMNEFDKLIEIFGEEASEGISILDMDTNNEIIYINKLSKAPSGYKADCKIRIKKTNNIYNISIKSKNGANPSLVNHTPRNAKIFQRDGVLFDKLNCLDIIIREYICKREKKEIGEDVSSCELTCLKYDNKLREQFLDVLLYFVFHGSGKGDSKCKADSIITYQGDKIILNRYDDIQKKKVYIESIYDKIVISLRDKGMPKIIDEYCKPWVFNDIKPDGSIKYKGSLHIRIK